MKSVNMIKRAQGVFQASARTLSLGATTKELPTNALVGVAIFCEDNQKLSADVLNSQWADVAQRFAHSNGVAIWEISEQGIVFTASTEDHGQNCHKLIQVFQDLYSIVSQCAGMDLAFCMVTAAERVSLTHDQPTDVSRTQAQGNIDWI